MELHKDIKPKEFIVKEDEAFRLRVVSYKSPSAGDINSISFIQECLRDGKVDFTSTYHFLMTDTELQTLAKGLINETEDK